MKRCPECRRDYYDDSLLYCLEDGAALVQGTVPIQSEPPTARFRTGNDPSESTTIVDRDIAAATSGDSPAAKTSLGRKVIISAAGLFLISGGAFFGARYFSASGTHVESIAVVPFVNDSGNADLEYLSDGMTETLISSLSRLPDLDVKPRSSVFRYKGKENDSQTIGKDLNVQAVLNGRVTQLGQDISLYIELIEIGRNKTIWSETYNRKQSDLVDLQRSIAKDVFATLRPKLSGSQTNATVKNETANPDAYRLYLKGRYYWDKRTRESFQIAIDAYKQAIAIDPNYALAYAGLADCYLFSTPSDLDRRESMLEAKAAALKALELTPSLAEAHTTLAFVKENFEFDMAGAEAGFKRAIELDPNYSIAHQFYGGFLIQTGRTDQGLSEARRALDLEPYSLALNWYWGLCLYMARRYDEAIAQLQATLQMQPQYQLAEGTLAQAYIASRRYDEALAILQSPERKADNRYHLAYLYAVSGHRAEALGLINQLGDRGSDVNPYQIAQVYAGLGDADRSIEWLEKGYERRTFQMFFLKAAPPWDPMRSDPRFEDLLRRMNLAK